MASATGLAMAAATTAPDALTGPVTADFLRDLVDHHDDANSVSPSNDPPDNTSLAVMVWTPQTPPLDQSLRRACLLALPRGCLTGALLANRRFRPPALRHPPPPHLDVAVHRRRRPVVHRAARPCLVPWFHP